MNNRNLSDMRKERRRRIWRHLRRNKAAMLGLVVIVLLVLTAIFANVIADYDEDALAMSPDRLKTPSAEHWFGTDSMDAIFLRASYTEHGRHFR